MDTRFTITLPAGIVRNDSAYAVKGRYINCNFVRSWEGKPQKWAGWGNYYDIALTEPARGGLVWNADDGTTLSAFGTANALWVIKAGVKYDITPQSLPAGLVDTTFADTGWGVGGWGSGPWGGGFSSVPGQGAFARVWTMARWGEDLMAAPRGGQIYFWDYSTANLEHTMTGVANYGNDGFTKVMLHFDGADAATTFTDSNMGGSAHTWTAAGNAQIDTAQKKFGTASGLFDGTGDWITTPDSSDFTLGSGAWTVDCWFRCNAPGGSYQLIAGQCDAVITAATASFTVGRSNTNVIQGSAYIGGVATTVTGTTQFTDAVNTGWHHVALVRTGSILRLFIDGVQEGGDVALVGTINNSAELLGVGNAGTSALPWLGWIDEFRLSVGVARWTSNFTPLSEQYHNSTTISQLSDAATINVGDRVSGGTIPAATYVVSVNTSTNTMVISNAAASAFTSSTLTFTSPAIALSSLTADAMLPSAVLGIFVTDDRELVAFGAAQTPKTYDALNIAWTDREDFTVWTPSSLNTAGAIRCESGNQIMGACKVFGGFLILTDLSAHSFTFQGGDDIWGLDRIGAAGGCIGPLAMIEVDGIAYWMGFNTMFTYNGRVNQLACDVHEAVFNNLNKTQAYKIYAATNRRYGEVLWFTPGTSTSLENDSYFGINTFDNAWQIGGALAGIDAPVSVDSFSRTTWIDGNPLIRTPLACDGTNFKLYQQESGTTADGSPISYMLETGELELRAQNGTIQASDQFLRLKKVVPDYAYVSGDHAMTVEARGYPNDPAVEKGPYDLSFDVMFNPKARGRHFRFLMTGTGDFRLGDFEAYTAPDGGRR